MEKSIRVIEVTGKIGIVPLTQGKIAWIDAEDVDKVKDFNWYYAKCYAVRIDSNRKTIRMHRVIMDTPDEMDTDHIDNCKLNNLKSNLRICSHAENCMNRTVRKDNKLRLKGVCWLKRYKKYTAQIQVNKIKKYLGYFYTQEEAYKAYCNAAKKYFGEYSNVI